MPDASRDTPAGPATACGARRCRPVYPNSGGGHEVPEVMQAAANQLECLVAVASGGVYPHAILFVPPGAAAP
ncbi:hypothetical protein MAFF301560_47500 (plasmid) [Ralstonia solanacearum]|nr:hypothetical protein MAFF301560_47500 [Ralstonia solanacearum]BEU49427.1 hypothetical protein MAFF211519_47520 [Ralstonia pseudosolanacearum]